MSEERFFYVYVDYRLDNDRPFYVGKGDAGRIRSFRRNQRHKNIREKHGLRRDVVLVTQDETFAFEHEVFLIKKLNTRNTSDGANFTDGGEGPRGFKHSVNARQLMSESHRGRKLSVEHIRSIQQAHLGRKYPPDSDVYASRRGKLKTTEHKRKLSESHLARRASLPKKLRLTRSEAQAARRKRECLQKEMRNGISNVVKQKDLET